VNLREFLPDLIKRIPGEAKLSLDIAPGLGASVSMDPHRLRSVLENLLINAYEACGECEFELILQRHRRDIIMRILDRGPGITPEDLERIFDPFFTTKTRGSGIGLAIARQFVNAAGGTLDYLPREGGGSEFRIVLKAAADGAADSEGENQ
jgi:signal transduction histidine kinase